MDVNHGEAALRILLGFTEVVPRFPGQNSSATCNACVGVWIHIYRVCPTGPWVSPALNWNIGHDIIDSPLDHRGIWPAARGRGIPSRPLADTSLPDSPVRQDLVVAGEPPPDPLLPYLQWARRLGHWSRVPSAR